MTNMSPQFTDRFEAGRLLARKLMAYAGRPETIVLALPRGGVPVAYEVARALKAPLDVFVVRKIGVPYHPELAMGAVAGDGTYAVNRDAVDALGITSDEFHTAFQNELQEVRRRELAYRQGRPQPDLLGKVVILVDDGLATGSTMRVGIDAVRRRHPKKVVVAVPVAPAQTQNEFSSLVDELVCVLTPDPFYAVGAYYSNFRQVDDTEVRDLLARAPTGKHAA
jgi:predicted phosphoribosyltransferase